MSHLHKMYYLYLLVKKFSIPYTYGVKCLNENDG